MHTGVTDLIHHTTLFILIYFTTTGESESTLGSDIQSHTGVKMDSERREQPCVEHALYASREEQRGVGYSTSKYLFLIICIYIYAGVSLLF